MIRPRIPLQWVQQVDFKTKVKARSYEISQEKFVPKVTQWSTQVREQEENPVGFKIIYLKYH